MDEGTLVNPVCFFCDEDLHEEEHCFGCDNYICNECDVCMPHGRHDIYDHVEDPGESS